MEVYAEFNPTVKLLSGYQFQKEINTVTKAN